ncbi:MAG: lipopolysaccharide heptosyltransferase II [Chlamydiota bacterium]
MHATNIIIRMPNWIGDFVMATAALEAVRRAFPQASITLMCQSPLQELVEGDPRFDEILVFQKEALKLSRRESRKNTAATLRLGKYDLGFLFTNSFSSAWYFWQGNVQRRVGYSKHCRSWLLTDRVPYDEKAHQVLAYLQIVEHIVPCGSTFKPHLFLEESDIEAAYHLLEQEGYLRGQYLVGIHPFAAYGQAKCWPAKKFRKLAEILLEDEEICLVFFGGREAHEQAQALTRGLGPRALNLVGKTSLRSLCSCIGVCDLFVTNDSGPMHIAAALDRELIALFGSTNAVKTGPYSKGEVIRKEVSCAPCYRRVCPIDFRCMERISVEEVVQKVREKKQQFFQK